MHRSGFEECPTTLRDRGSLVSPYRSRDTRSMLTRRVGFLGVRSGAAAEGAAFFRDVLGLPMLRDDPNWSILKLPTGTFDYVEFYGTEFADQRVVPDDTGLLVAFVVDDVVAARHEVLAAGASATDIVWAEQEFGEHYRDVAWFFFRAPDGNMYCIEQVPDPTTDGPPR